MDTGSSDLLLEKQNMQGGIRDRRRILFEKDREDNATNFDYAVPDIFYYMRNVTLKINY